jgi:UDP-glucose 4-epimerase
VGINNLKTCVVTGGAGFIGSNLVDRLLLDGFEVRVVDNFRTGNNYYLDNKDIEVYNVDLLSENIKFDEILRGIDTVFHLAANADVRAGWDHPQFDFQQNTFATVRLLEACSKANVREFIFSSTGSVYGETKTIPTPENAPFPVQTSLYAASKVSAEAFIQAYCEAQRIKSTVFRFVSVLGPRYSHGHVIDFVRQLIANPNELRVLGDGTQRKSYMNVRDCIEAVVSLRGPNNFEVFNLGFDGFCELNNSISWITEIMGCNPKIDFLGGSKGWIGDNPFIWLDVSKGKSFGWQAMISIEDSVKETVEWLLKNSKLVGL